MSPLLPGYKEQLGARATVIAAQHEGRRRGRVPAPGGPRRRRRPHGRNLIATILLAAVAASGVAYASQGLWRPPMGDDRRGHPAASASPLPPALLDRYAVLRREQTEADRGAGSRDALRWQSPGYGAIQTGAVRRLGTGPDDTAIVFLAMAGKKTPGGAAGRTKLVCVWQQDPVEAGGMSCDSPEAAARRGVWLTTLIDAEPSQALVRRRTAWTKRNAGRNVDPPAWVLPRADTMRMAGIVPDGVAAVRISSRPEVTPAPVRGNVFQATAPIEALDEGVVWLDRHGRVIPQPPEPKGRMAPDPSAAGRAAQALTSRLAPAEKLRAGR